MSQTIITVLLAVLTFTCCIAREKKPILNATLKGYHSGGAIDEGSNRIIIFPFS